MSNIRVIIVDDSALIRGMFEEILNGDPDIEVVAVAEDPYDAREKIKEHNPDVITLDIEMPKMDGLTFLDKIMSLRPMPVVMVSSLTQKGAEATFKALEMGAVDYVPKTGSQSFDIDNLRDELIEKVKAAAKAKVKYSKEAGEEKTEKVKPVKVAGVKTDKLVAIGSSTGGVEALGQIIPYLPEKSPPIVITQHMPEKFTETFAQRLDRNSTVTVTEAKDKEEIKPGHVYIAPGGFHLEVVNNAGKYRCSLNSGEKVSGHKPSVDVLFSSVAKAAGDKAIGVMLTGMGKDGSIGMVEMKKAGSYNIGQDENSCVVYGMPKAAFLAGAVDEQVSLKNMAKEILKACN